MKTGSIHVTHKDTSKQTSKETRKKKMKWNREADKEGAEQIQELNTSGTLSSID
jgi:hypothetical protein